MLAWSWLVCLFFMPELLVKAAARRAQLADKPYWRHLCAAGGAVNIAGGSSAWVALHLNWGVLAAPSHVQILLKTTPITY